MKSRKSFIFSIVLLFVIGFTTMALADRYVDNGDGTITDTMTGLIWQKANDGISRMNSDAKTYCQDLVLGGSQDWRLPRVDELQTIVDYSRLNPSVDPIFIHNGSLGCWSDTHTAFSNELCWGVSFADGYTGNIRCDYPDLVVRCVRGGPFWTPDTSGRLEIYGEEIVKDVFNHKMWQKYDNGITCTWDEANQYCGQLTTGGFIDWRLPINEELRNIIDYTIFSPAMDPIFLATGQGGFYWSATPSIQYLDRRWYTNFTDGVITTVGPGLAYVRCVRDEPAFAFTLTVTPSGAGLVTASLDEPYFYGDVVILIATANPGYTFKYWTKDGVPFPDRKSSKNSSIQIIVDGDLSLTANFVKQGKKQK